MARRRYHKPQPRVQEPRRNHRIKAHTLRVVIEGEGQFVMSRDEALSKAQSLGLDLVEISPDQNPPVCKIIDYGKFKYEQQKKKKEQSRNQHTIQTKEIKMRPKIGVHDYDLKLKNGRKFLDNGDKLKVSLRFRGREITHPELGQRLLEKFAKDLEEVGQVDQQPKMEGRQLVMTLSPKKAAGKKAGPQSPKKGLASKEASPRMAPSKEKQERPAKSPTK